ncbi:MAG TPA: YfhO family protein [Oscillospiraceae bacterium]|nr:YfhO family protein [Oscillospiraceae bacterium]
MKKRWYYLLAPIATAVLVLIIYFNYHLYPFTSQTLAWCDMKQQVIPILLDFKNILSGQSNMFLNLSNAGGMSFWGVFLFFISSPFSFLVAFIDKSAIYVFVNILVLLKMSLCAFTASIFFGRQFKKLYPAQNIALSVMYAFCGYTMMYFQNIVWLDMMCIFPILLIGLDLLIEQDKIWPFVLAFSATIVINFYLSYMVVQFLVLSFGVYILFFTNKERRRKSILLLCVATILVALITAVVWLPSLMQYLNSARTVGLLKSVSSGSLFTNIYTTLPMILCSSAILAVMPVLPALLDYKNGKAVTTFIIFVLVLIPLIIDPINKMWHTGSYQAFPTRFGYMVAFLGLILLAGIISKLNIENETIQNDSNRLVTIGLTVAFTGTVLLAKLLLDCNYSVLSVYTKSLWESKDSATLFILFAFVSALVYLLIMITYKYHYINRSIFSFLLCIMVICQCIFSGNIFLGSAANSSDAYQYVLDLSGKINDNSLYRVKNDKKYFDANLLGGLGFNTLNHYTSLTGKDYMYTMKKLGYSSYWMEVNSNGGTECSDAILANKYSVLYTSELNNNSNAVYSNRYFSIAKNELSLPLGMIVNSDNIDKYKNLPQTSRMGIQQSLFQAVFNTNQNLLTNYDISTCDNVDVFNGDELTTVVQKTSAEDSFLTYNIEVNGTQTLYFDCFDNISNNLSEADYGSFDVTVNGKSIEKSYPKKNNNGLLNLGTFTNEVVSVKIDVLKTTWAKSFGVTGVNLDTLRTAVSQAKTANLKQEGNTIIGTAAADGADQYLFLPLAYDDGYNICINNQPAQIHRVFDAFMAVKLNKGSNTITITYNPQGFRTGLFISVAGLLAFAVILLLFKHGLYKRIKCLELPATILFSLLFAAVIIGIYIFPVVAYFKNK